MSFDSVIPVSEARSRLSEIVDHVTHEHRPVHLSRRGRRVVAVIDANDLEMLMDLAQQAADALAADDARTEALVAARPHVPWDDVRRDLGLA